MAIALAVAAVVIYVPGLNNVVLGGGPVPALAFLAPIAAGTLLIAYEFLRIFLRRRGKFRREGRHPCHAHAYHFSIRVLWWGAQNQS